MCARAYVYVHVYSPAEATAERRGVANGSVASLVLALCHNEDPAGRERRADPVRAMAPAQPSSRREAGEEGPYPCFFGVLDAQVSGVSKSSSFVSSLQGHVGIGG